MKRMLLLCALLAQPLMSAESPDTAAMQPAVNTSPTMTAPAPARAAAPAAQAAAPAAAPAAPGPARSAPATTRARAQDRLELDTTQITGNRELPRVLYVVPWKRSDLGDLTGRPVNSLLDEVLAPVDRDVFKRQNRYYDALKPEAAAGSSEGEK